jgi:hypothetical protein
LSIDALDLFFGSATQYYVAGRFAFWAGQSPVAGNLLHHAIEMYLKGGLAKQMSLQQLKQLSHNLPNVWSAFKTQFPDPALARFDNLIHALHECEELRYPDSVLANGARIRMGVFREPGIVLAPSSAPEYELYLNEVDALVTNIFVAVPVIPVFFLSRGNPTAREYLVKENAESWAV